MLIQKYSKLLLFIFLLFVLNSAVFCDTKRGLFWKAVSKSNTVYLLGSIHVGKKSMYPLPKKILTAYQKSDYLVLEVNPLEVNPFAVMKYAMYDQHSDSLKNNISKETYELALMRAKQMNIPEVMVNRSKPWFLAVTIIYKELEKLGLSQNYGIDNFFIKNAKDGKTIIGLETAEFQLQLFNSMSKNEQEKFLLYNLEEDNELEKMMRSLLSTWDKGDAKEFNAIFKKDLKRRPALKNFYHKLIDERNDSMTKKISEFLSKKETYFVVIGAGHLVGDNGVVNQLRKKGFQVEQQ